MINEITVIAFLLLMTIPLYYVIKWGEKAQQRQLDLLEAIANKHKEIAEHDNTK